MSVDYSGLTRKQRVVMKKNIALFKIEKLVKILLFPIIPFVRDIHAIRILIFGEIKIIKWDKTYFTDRYTLIVRKGMSTIALTSIHKSDLEWFATDIENTKGQYTITDVNGEYAEYKLTKFEKNKLHWKIMQQINA